MKALKSNLAKKAFAIPKAREQLRSFAIGNAQIEIRVGNNLYRPVTVPKAR